MAKKPVKSETKRKITSSVRKKSTRKASKKAGRSTISKALSKSRKKTKKASPRKKTAKKAASKKSSLKKTAAPKKRVASKATRIQFKEEHLDSLPFSYDETLLVLLVRDPEWVYSYWDFSGETWAWIQTMRKKKPGLRSVLRVHNLDEQSFFDIDVNLETKNWYLNLAMPDCAFEVDLGMVDVDGKFYLIVKSNRIRTPRKGPSEVIDEAWKSEKFDLIYRLSGGYNVGSGSEIFSQFIKTKG